MKKIFDLIKKEERRQRDTLMMIPSENITYPEVLKAVGSILMQKYAEGQPGRRYYQGNKYVDEIERLTESEALSAFNLNPLKWSANVQPHSGSEANLAVYNAILSPGDKILSMFLPDGGHLSHGWQLPDKKVTLVSKIYNVDYYRVDPVSQVFNYDKIEAQAIRFKPKLIISGGTAYPRTIDHKRLSQIAKKVGAYYMADIAHEAGLIAGRAFPSPFPYADFVTMTTHKTLRGPRGAIIICRKKLEGEVDFSIIPGIQGGPHLHTIAGICIALNRAKKAEFKKYAKQVIINAKVLASEFENAGLKVVSGGTDKHLVLIDLRKTGTNGWMIAWALEKAGIIVNRNTVPGETASPFYPSGLRLGTPAITVRGMKEKEMKQIAKWIIEVIERYKEIKMPDEKQKRSIFTKKYLADLAEDKYLRRLSLEVKKLTGKFC